MNGIFVLIWGWILNWLCSKGLKAISWILVLLPFILFIITFFFAKDIISNATYEEGFCTADDVSKIETAFSALQSSMQNRPEQSQIENALTTFKSTLDGITTEAKMNAMGVQEGFQEGANTKRYSDCVTNLDGSKNCKTFGSKKEAEDSKKAREKAAADAKEAKEKPARDKQIAEMKAYEQKMADAAKKREEIAAKNKKK